MEKIKIIGGSSLPRRITIYSDKFTSQATYTFRGELKVRIKSRNPFAKKWHDKWWVPRILKHPTIALGFWNSVLSAFYSSGSNRRKNKLGFRDFFSLLSALLVLRQLIAKWHGAEHMAIEAYWQSGETSLDAIKKHSPISKRCGGRYLVPQLSIQLVAYNTRLPAWVHPAGELMLFELDGRWKILQKWPFDKLNHLLQKYFTTSKPGERELKTAQAAMLTLIEAHNKLQQNP